MFESVRGCEMVCESMRQYARVCEIVRGYARVFESFREYAMCEGVPHIRDFAFSDRRRSHVAGAHALFIPPNMSSAVRHQLSGEDEKIVAGRTEVQYCGTTTEASRADTSIERRKLVGERV